MKPTQHPPLGIKWVYSSGGYGNDNKRGRRLERRARARQTAAEVNDETQEMP